MDMGLENRGVKLDNIGSVELHSSTFPSRSGSGGTNQDPGGVTAVYSHSSVSYMIQVLHDSTWRSEVS